MISLVKPTPPKKIKADLKFGTIKVGSTLDKDKDDIQTFVIRRNTTAELFAKNNLHNIY